MARNSSEHLRPDPPRDTRNVRKDIWDGPGVEHNSSGRRGRVAIRVARPQRKVTENSTYGSSQGINATNRDKFGPLPGWKGRTRARGGRKRGRRTVRSKLKAAKRMSDTAAKRASARSPIKKKTPSSYQQEWTAEEATPILVEGAGNLSSSEKSESDGENSQAVADDYDDLAIDDYSGGFRGEPARTMGGLSYAVGEENDKNDVDDEEDDADEEEEGNEEERQREEGAEEYYSSESEERNRFVGRDQMGTRNKGLEFSSSDYSD